MAIWQVPSIPRSLDPNLGRWLQYLTRDLGNFINYQPWTTFRFDPVDSFDDIPTQLQEGVMVYAKESIPGGPGKGLNVWDGTEWLRATPAVGYGGISQSANVDLINISGGWTLLPADTELVTTPKNLVQDLALDGLQFLKTGVWQVTIVIGFEHNISQAGRLTNVRVVNTTTGQSSAPVQFATGRNTEHTGWTGVLFTEIQEAQIGDNFSVQLGGGDEYSLVVLDSYAFSATLLEEF